ncbi:sigma-70 family RNA polymerase sigma factor [Fodinicola feengrottensis]|uniref:RNA polymerase sigma factor 70 region 4 type 2 domain-containing protein n=1 Tax=Fodinicola feengrottensis TaxID=435914 RepID=A0ABN2IY52_9ACTN|nr:sigma-70 family RNA polymerase sigma factor [Fodinicola feengrottensis]
MSPPGDWLATTGWRAEEPRKGFARWTARWFGRTTAVPSSRFQDHSEPFPGHWRRFPDPWSPAEPTDPRVRDALAAALDQLPATWRTIIVAHDGLGLDATAISRRSGLSPRQQRAILNKARAVVRDHLARALIGPGDQ